MSHRSSDETFAQEINATLESMLSFVIH